MATEGQLRRELCATGELLWRRGLIGASEGNLSVRLGSEQILCTAAGGSKGGLVPEDLCVIDLVGNSMSDRKPSSEILMHLRIYEMRPDCSAVVHAHPPISTAYALTGEDIPVTSLPEAMAILGPIKVLSFAMPGTQAVADGMTPYLKDHKTFLLGNHGAVTLGKDLKDAYERMETLERMAAVSAAAKIIGSPQKLPERELSALIDKYLHGRLS